jgi:hypothetical protein
VCGGLSYRFSPRPPRHAHTHFTRSRARGCSCEAFPCRLVHHTLQASISLSSMLSHPLAHPNPALPKPQALDVTQVPRGLETPQYRVLRAARDYEVRSYPSYLVAEAPMGQNTGGRGGGGRGAGSARPQGQGRKASRASLHPWRARCTGLEGISSRIRPRQGTRSPGPPPDSARCPAPGPAGGAGFNDLARYIFGGNSQKESLEMTTPVLTEPTEGGARMSFVMEDRFPGGRGGQWGGGPLPRWAGGNAVGRQRGGREPQWRHRWLGTPLAPSGRPPSQHARHLFSPAHAASLHPQQPNAAPPDVGALPAPLDPKVTTRRVAPQYVAASRFSGWAFDWEVDAAERALRAALLRDGLNPGLGYKLARYNEPTAPPFLRRNEVLIELQDYAWP